LLRRIKYPFEDMVVSARELCFGIRGSYIPCDIIDGRRTRLEVFMAFLLYWYCPPKCRILDPTCGKENYQFGKLKQRLYREVEYIDGDIQPFGSYVGDVFHLPFRDNVFDLVIYDPPYLPYTRYDKRAEDYAILHHRTLKEIRKFYSKEVLEELARVLRPGGYLIVKGADFYYPITSSNLILFIPDILNPRIVSQLRLIARYYYAYYRGELRLQRARLNRATTNRPLITTTVYVVFRKTTR